MGIKFLDVIERDIDILILEEIVFSQKFADIFLSKVGLSGAKVIEVEHSKTDIELGETDITVIVQNGGKKHGLLIEDKIDAIAQPEQCKRYDDRGKLGVKNNDYDSYDVFIVAPEKYLKDNDEAMKYPNKVLYEELVKYFSGKTDVRSKFKLVQLEQAISHQRTGYKVVEVASVTRFWNNYIDYQNEKYGRLMSLNNKGPKGAKSTWFTYKTVHKDVTIVHKTEKGYVDLSFRGGNGKIDKLVKWFEDDIENFKESGMTVETAGKSAVLRIKVSKVDVFDEFDKYIDNVDEGLKAVEKFNEIALHLNQRKLQDILQERE